MTLAKSRKLQPSVKIEPHDNGRVKGTPKSEIPARAGKPVRTISDIWRRAEVVYVVSQREKSAIDEAREALLDDERDESLARVQVGDDPGVQSSRDLGQLTVIDPYDDKPRAKVTALRDDPVGRMHKLGQLGKGRDADEASARLKAARHYQNLYHRAEISGARGIDPTREYVDGGQFQMPDTDNRLRAQNDLAKIDAHIGEQRTGLLRLILVHLLDVATFTGDNEQARRSAIREIRDVLSMVAVFVGIQGRAPSTKPIRDDHSEMARYADEPEVHRAMHRIKRRAARN